MDPGTGLIIASITKEVATTLIQRHGSQAVIAGLRAWTQHSSGRSSNLGHEEAMKQAKNAIPSFLSSIESNSLHVIPGAFNSSPEFIAMFQAEALVAIPVALLAVKQAIDRVGSSLQGIQHELTITNMAKIQGWEQEGFGAHVYRFVEYEMLQVANARAKSSDQRQHYFYVWNRDTDWYPVFEAKNRAFPLGSGFGGYHHELDAICMRMRADRRTLIQTTSHGRTAQFHLLVPTHQPYVLDHPVIFHESLFPLTITGQRHRSVDLVWFNLCSKPTGLQLQCIGVLGERANTIEQAGALSLAGCCIGFMAAGCAAIAFPPCAPLAEAVALPLWSGAAASWSAAAGASVYEHANRGELCILGDDSILVERKE
ncbi:hypothetical protein ASPVEDRAFT_43424 [Aspergillus versicolor CBS 583.65]|uniref:Uncharacterized protein n=1 Tax=Aspergillus versicolor CBS 583.65 TaxID=1036611 RepID=A0A1L9PR12_ASPVE|nr:uncharacterized protein ASPVEDRAFT_43424 [Aspergillus versicolor CBS 583.65]OJJ03960.1 hypothetical protein ASPVEDRAFT_43424 [Aspergillus versicolor CBS 583.65]